MFICVSIWSSAVMSVFLGIYGIYLRHVREGPSHDTYKQDDSVTISTRLLTLKRHQTNVKAGVGHDHHDIPVSFEIQTFVPSEESIPIENMSVSPYGQHRI
ncbi:uncharacterized protein Z520_06613 [Fonsecaea multimorphosa CBS 102226]|uniref:Uncharacterized protein n=1 Tax=Fonsecaea multimorphosa CBS 102226 TaxID=1442371 RepID=A0A0D2H7N0_9EURO|nr:uncharacterized protein Z520_06613 [Fonsecaea multimorphosa CBS 102226]KIX97835.1 hypothetical protein Z520_06613 [Fonsecaea multimorphosa CBS 102226]OAL23605.1 hypothetical protein AYO22_06182 [Fonsecaea multimorphosa]